MSISIGVTMPIKCAFIEPSCGNRCEEEAKYKFKHDAKASRCKAHMLEGMKNASSNLCFYGDCIKSPIYNYVGHTAKYCILHKEPEMINVITPRCIFILGAKHSHYIISQANKVNTVSLIRCQA